MGTFNVDVEIGNPSGDRYESVSALVDTGSTYTVIPRPILERLSVKPTRSATFRLGDESTLEAEIGQTWLRIDGTSVITQVVFGAADARRLLGAYALEGLLLAADPVKQRLVPVEGLMMNALERAGAS